MATTAQLIRVGLLSQDSALQPLLSSGLGNEFEICLESGESEINELIEESDCTVAIVDLNSNEPGLKTRLECARRLISGSVPVIVLADDALRIAANELVREGAFSYCRRPPSLRELRVTVRNAHDKVIRRREFGAQKQRLDDFTERNQMVGSSPAMIQVHDLIGRVAGIDASVLINGESGTGKELIARAIHSSGSRARRPFVAVACGAIPETLIEAELFGHEKGAFTGTVGAREGFFRTGRPTAPCSWTRLASLRSIPRSSFCASCSSASSAAWAPAASLPCAPASSSPPTAISARWSPRANSARTSITAST